MNKKINPQKQLRRLSTPLVISQDLDWRHLGFFIYFFGSGGKGDVTQRWNKKKSKSEKGGGFIFSFSFFIFRMGGLENGGKEGGFRSVVKNWSFFHNFFSNTEAVPKVVARLGPIQIRVRMWEMKFLEYECAAYKKNKKTPYFSPWRERNLGYRDAVATSGINGGRMKVISLIFLGIVLLSLVSKKPE